MRDAREHDPVPPPGPELLSLTVLLLAAALVVAALSYSSVVTHGRDDVGTESDGAPCPTMAGCEGRRGISPGARPPAM